jgi:hypothetical protein
LPNIPGLDNIHVVPVEEYDPPLFAGRRPDDHADSFIASGLLPYQFFSGPQGPLDALDID